MTVPAALVSCRGKSAASLSGVTCAAGCAGTVSGVFREQLIASAAAAITTHRSASSQPTQEVPRRSSNGNIITALVSGNGLPIRPSAAEGAYLKCAPLRQQHRTAAADTARNTSPWQCYTSSREGQRVVKT